MKCPNEKCPLFDKNMIKSNLMIELYKGKQEIYICEHCKTIVRVEFWDD